MRARSRIRSWRNGTARCCSERWPRCGPTSRCSRTWTSSDGTVPRPRSRRWRPGWMWPLLAEFFDGSLESRSGGGQILRIHRRPYSNAGVESQEKWFRDLGKFGGFFHVEDNDGAPLAIITGYEVACFGFEIRQYFLNRGLKSPVPNHSVRRLIRHNRSQQ